MNETMRRPVIAAAAGLLLALAPNAHAARLPDWAKTIADNAPAVEEIYEDPTRLLFNEIHIKIDKNGDLSTRWRSATQILSSGVSRLRTQEFHFREGSILRVCRGWHVPAGDKAQKVDQSLLELAVGDSFLDDLRARFVRIGGVSRGSIVFFESEVEEQPVHLAMSQIFGDDAETLLERFEVEVPSAGWSVRSAWLRRQGPAPVIEENVWRWEMKGLAALRDEPKGVPAEHEAPLLLVSLVPPSGFRTGAQVFRDWPTVSAWWEGVAKGREAVTPEIEAATKKALAGAPDGFFERARILSRYVRDSVRYVAKEIGIENYQPRPAARVFAQLHGDCKDKATLLRSMLKVAGIDSYHLHVNATTPDTFSVEVPTWAWNHAIVAVAVPAATDVPKGFAPAVVDGGDLGRLLIVDPTNSYAAIGALPPSLQGKTTLVHAGSRSRLLALPVGDSSQHRVERKFVTRIQPDQSLAIETTWRFSGAAAEWARSMHGESYGDRRKAAEGELLEAFVHGEPKSYSVESETADGLYTETMSWRVPPADGVLKEVPLFIGAADSLPRTSIGSKRRTPVNYRYPLTFVYETRMEGAPLTAALPPADKREGLGWSITTSCEREGDAILAKWEMVLSKPRFDVESLGELKKLWRSIGSTGSASIHLVAEKCP